MFIARWTVDVRFGHKDEFSRLSRAWSDEVGSKIGWTKPRVLSGSIGATESRFETEITVSSLDELERAWAKLATLPAHKKFGAELETHIVSGSNRWDVFRVVE